jgi:AcrR family transcriptional regulator
MALGRPRAFDTKKALDRALKVFWKKGYEGTSLADLTKAMRINRPSLYAAFGNKESLFRQVLDRYVEGPAAFVREALLAPTSREVVQRLLFGTADLLSDSANPRGCLMVQGALACGEAAGPIRQELASRRIAVEVAFRRRFERARAEGDLPADSDPEILARYVATLIQGMSVQAAGGASGAELRRVVEHALQSWPGSGP